MATVARPALDIAALRARCTGLVAGPGDEGYDQARMPWNVAVDQRPAAVAVPADVQDVVSLVRAAAAADLRIAVQGTGHAASTLGDLGDALLIRTTALTHVEIDPVGRIAAVGAGAIWEQVTVPAAAHGLVSLPGSSPDVGVAGYTLGGGTGYLARKHGLACNRVTAIELVTATGEIVRAERDQEPDLFWALRGGSGRFGVVTALELSLMPAEELYAGAMFWPWERSAEVVHAWRELTARAPRELTSMLRIFQFPPIPQIPEPMRGRSLVNVQAAYAGDAEAGAELLRGLRDLGPEMDTFGPMDPVGLLRLHGDPEGPTPGMTEGGLLDSLPAEAVDALLAVAGPGSGSPLLNVELRHFGGALAEAPDGAGALATVDGEYGLHSVGIPMGPEAAMAIAAHRSKLMEALAPYGSGRGYVNFAGRPTDPRSLYDAATLARLEAVRATVDPDGRLRTGLRDA